MRPLSSPGVTVNGPPVALPTPRGEPPLRRMSSDFGLQRQRLRTSPAIVAMTRIQGTLGATRAAPRVGSPPPAEAERSHPAPPVARPEHSSGGISAHGTRADPGYWAVTVRRAGTIPAGDTCAVRARSCAASPRGSYGAFITQGPVLAAIALALRWARLPGDTDFVLLATLGVTVSLRGDSPERRNLAGLAARRPDSRAHQR